MQIETGPALEVAGPNYLDACGAPLYYLLLCIKKKRIASAKHGVYTT